MAKNKYISLIFITVLVAVFSFRLWQTTGCKQFFSFYFNPDSIKIAVESQILEDRSLKRPVSRFFHNKISTGIFEIAKSYSATIDVRFLIAFLGPLGLLLVIIAVAKVVKSPKTRDKLWLLPFLISLILTSSANPKNSFYLTAISWYFLSFQGVSFFTKSNILKIIFILLIPATLLYFSFNWQMSSICNEIFFN